MTDMEAVTHIAENSWKITYRCSFRYDNEFDLQSNPVNKETEGATESIKY